MATLSELLNKVATYGGKIASTSELSEMEIATANACNNMFVDENALGYVWVGKDVSSVPQANEIIPHVSGSAFVIMFQKKPLKNILFQSDKEARNYIKMQNPKRKFKEPKENVFVCSRYGTTFEIVELHYR